MRSISVISLVLLLLTASFAQAKDTTGYKSGSKSKSGYDGSASYQSGQDGSAQAPNTFFLGAGPASLDGLAANAWSVQFFGGRQWTLNRFLAPKAVLEATTDFGGSALISGLIGANLYPVMSVISPYLGAGAGIGYARASTDTDVLGFDLNGSFGLLMFQTSPIKINFETSANFIFRELIPDEGMPMTFTARVGVLF